MLTYEDCVGLTDLDEEEIEAIAQHEHVPEIIAAELGCCLVHEPQAGVGRIRQMLREDAEEARQLGEDSRYWKVRLSAIERELADEPDRIRRSYNVRATRIEAVGVVYLWPLSS